jgi:glycosyltransferase involved in cell wall biosynthesis
LISIVTPFYNEEESLPKLVSQFKSGFENVLYDYEVVFVNDGSSDGSLKLLLKLQEKNPWIKILDLNGNHGHQTALIAGLDFAKGKSIITMDSDLQDPVSVLPKLIQKWLDGSKVVYARRIKRNGESFSKKLFAFVFYRVLKIFSYVNVPVDVGDFRLIDREILEELKVDPLRSFFVRGAIAKYAKDISFVDFERDERFAGDPKYSTYASAKLALKGLLLLCPLTSWLLYGLFRKKFAAHYDVKQFHKVDKKIRLAG